MRNLSMNKTINPRQAATWCILLVFLLCCQCGDSVSPDVNPNLIYLISYGVTASGDSASIAMIDELGRNQYFKILLPWTYVFQRRLPAGTYVYLRAQLLDSTGHISATIYNADTVCFTHSDTGSYPMAVASGTLE